MKTRRHAWVLVLSCACGPAVAEQAPEMSTTTDASSGSTGGTLEPSTTGTPPGSASDSSSSAAASTETTTGANDTESSSEEAGGFLVPTGGCGDELPDGVLAHCSIECTAWEQDCGDEEACRAWANDGGDVWNGWRCVPVDPEPAGLGEQCVAEASPVSGLDTCDAGLMCWNVDAKTLAGTCAEYCGGTELDPTCSTPGATCVVGNDGILPLCLPSCDPLAPVCDRGFGCYPGSNENFVCLREGERMYVGEEFQADCPTGTFWASAEQVDGCTPDEPCCVPYCDTGDPGVCGLDLECAPYFDVPPPQFANLGYCRPAGA